jgi:LemA protein
VLALVVLAVLPLGAALWLHNGLVAKREAIDASWAQVESNYQRRADLIPALVEAVERHLRHESETFERVVAARSSALELFTATTRSLGEAQAASTRALGTPGDGAPASEADLRGIAAAQEQIGSGIRQVLALAESYPQLRSADHFLELQAQLEGSENRITVARMSFNEAVRGYNAAIEQVPASYIAESKGYERRAYFATREKARHAAPLGFD